MQISLKALVNDVASPHQRLSPMIFANRRIRRSGLRGPLAIEPVLIFQPRVDVDPTRLHRKSKEITEVVVAVIDALGRQQRTIDGHSRMTAGQPRLSS